MEESTAETAESVNTESQDSEPVSAPTTGEDSQSSDSKSGEVEVQLSPKAQQRMQKLANEAKEGKRWKSEHDKLQTQYQSAKDAIAMDQWLRADQKRAAAFIEWAKAQENPQPTEDPYAQFAPEVAEKFRKLDALETWQKQQEQQAEQGRVHYIQQNQAKLDEHFDSLLKSKGFVDEGGKIDEDLAYALSRGTLAVLADSIQDPRLATQAQVEQAFDKLTKGLSMLEKRALKKVVKQPGVPASGTGFGKSVDRKIDWSNPDNRIAHLTSALKG